MWVHLTEREVDVALGVARGKSNKEIARDIGISPYTVRDHVSALLHKTGTSRRVRLMTLLGGSFLLGLDLLL
jgi:DNA-binding NarL/FixJ family response regulator